MQRANEMGKKWVTRARRVGERNYNKEKAEERANTEFQEEDGGTKRMREKKWRSKRERK